MKTRRRYLKHYFLKRKQKQKILCDGMGGISGDYYLDVSEGLFSHFY